MPKNNPKENTPPRVDPADFKGRACRCPLCHGERLGFYFADSFRTYLDCQCCGLVFVPPRYRLDSKAEKAVYDLHVNDVGDQGYRRFLSRLATPLLERLPPARQGLDFGCGPGPELAAMMEEAGHRMRLFDLFYYNAPEVLTHSYDFIVATEVVEHLQDPYAVFQTLFRILKPGGWLGMMTKQVMNPEAFSQWHYIRDKTHICFYSKPVFEYLAQQFNAVPDFIGNDVILLKKAGHLPLPIDERQQKGAD